MTGKKATPPPDPPDPEDVVDHILIDVLQAKPGSVLHTVFNESIPDMKCLCAMGGAMMYDIRCSVTSSGYLPAWVITTLNQLIAYFIVWKREDPRNRKD